VPITPETAVQVSAVYGCCRLIVDSIAAAPIRVYQVESGGRREVLHDDATSYTLNWGADPARFPDAPTSQAVEEALFWSALLTGNGYAEIQRDLAGRFVALWPLEPERVIPRRDDTGAYFYEVFQPNGGTARLEARDCFHVRGPSLYGWVGDSPVYRAAKAIGIAQASQVFAAAYFANGTILSGIIKTPGKLTEQQKKDFGASWKANYGGGPGKSHGTPILDQGLDYQAINHDAQKAQLVESRRFQVQEVARFFGVPTTLLADNEAWTNLSELYLGFYRNALLPWVARFDAEATRKLFPQRAPWREVAHDLTQLVMGSFKDQVVALRVAVDGGLKTRNEARAILGDNSLGEEGDVLMVSGAVKSLDQALEPAAPPAPATPPDPEEDDPPKAPAAPGAGSEPAGPPMPMDRRPRPAAQDIARIAIALDRCARRMEARRKDLDRNAPDKLEANLSIERDRQVSSIRAELAAVIGDNAPDLDMRASKAADAVLAGEPAHLAAVRCMESE
jgi:HK97 family phage portal protein